MTSSLYFLLFSLLYVSPIALTADGPIPLSIQAPWPQLAAMHDTTPFAPLAETLSASLGSTYALALCLTLLSGVPFQGSAVAAAPAAADGPPAKPPLPRAVPASSSTSSSSSSGRAAKSSTQPKPIAPALTGKAPPPEPERALI